MNATPLRSDERKCVWYISKYVVPPGLGSVGARGFMLMRELARLGHRAVIVTSDSNTLAQFPPPGAAYAHRSIDGVDVWVVRTLRYKVAKSVRRILSWLHFEWRLLRMPHDDLPPPDAVVASSLSLLTILSGFRLRRRYRCRLVFEVRDIWPLTITQEGGFGRFNPVVLFLGWVERLGYRHADVVVGTMPNLREHVRGVLGYDRPVHCVPMGIDCGVLDEPPEISAEYRDAYIPRDAFVVAHAGTIGITNALEPFFECARACQDVEGIHFLMVGEGDLKAEYIERYGALPNLTFAPRVDKRLVHSVLSNCDLLYFSVHESEVWRYGQSLNKIIDYMLAGKPVVASYSGFPSMIDESGCGTFVPAGDVSALRSEVLRYADMAAPTREAIGARGRDWLFENRCYSRLARDFEEILFGE